MAKVKLCEQCFGSVREQMLAKRLFCKVCQKPNIIYRLWRNDFWCGWCGAEYKINVMSYLVYSHLSQDSVRTNGGASDI